MRRTKEAYDALRRLASVYPLETNLVFLCLGLLVGAAVFQNFLHNVLTYELRTWHLLVAGLVLLLVLRLRRIRRLLTDVLKWPTLGVSAFLVIVVAAAIFLMTRPDVHTLRVVDARLDFPIESKMKNEFIAQLAFLLRLHDASSLTSDFPGLFKDEAHDLIQSDFLEYQKAVESAFESVAASPSLQILLRVNNGLGSDVTVYSVTGTIRIGDSSGFYGSKTTKIEGRTVVTDEYLHPQAEYQAEFDMQTDKMTFPSGSAGEDLLLTWQIPSDLKTAAWVRDALLFELRGGEFMDMANNDLQWYLKQIYLHHIEQEFGVPPARSLGVMDFEYKVLQVDFVLHHTFGDTKFRKTFAVGFVEGVQASDIVEPWR